MNPTIMSPCKNSIYTHTHTCTYLHYSQYTAPSSRICTPTLMDLSVNMRTCTHTQIHTCIVAYMYTCMHTHIFPSCMHTYEHMHIHTNTPTILHSCMHAYILNIHVYAHTNAFIYIHTYKHTPLLTYMLRLTCTEVQLHMQCKQYSQYLLDIYSNHNPHT